MSTDLTVEGIVAQIRKRISEESAQGSNGHPINSFPAAIPTQPDYRACMADDSRRFVDLETQIDAAAEKIGGKPPVPPTWRGRFGSWAIDVLQRFLWWYAAPIQETIGLLNRRNREQAARHLRTQEQILSVMDGLQQVLSRTETLEALAREAADWQNENRASRRQVQRQLQELSGWQSENRVSRQQIQQQLRELVAWQDENRASRQEVQQQLQELGRTWISTRSEVSALAEQAAKVDIGRVAERLTQKLEELRETRIQREQSLKQQIDELKGNLQELRASSAASDSFRAELEQRISETAHTVGSQLPELETRLRAEAEAREALAGGMNSLLEQRAQSFTGQIDELKGTLQALRAASAAADSLRAELDQRVSESLRTAWGRLPVLDTQVRVEAEAREALAVEINGHVVRLEQKITEGMADVAGRASHLSLALDKQRSELRLQENRVAMFLREVRHQLPKTLTETQVLHMTEELETSVAALYAEFEDVFRGPRDLIKERLQVYIPRLVQAKVGSPTAPVLDLGCGRGEWLQLLSEHKLTGSGVDLNPNMISRCEPFGVEVVKADALAHLRSLPDKSLGAITSFHMIEHLPFDTVLEIVDEALRVLRSGGLLILETPNPQNTLTGSLNFWIDPTHLRPIPSQTLRFFVEARGFCQVEVLNLQPYSEDVRVPENCGAVAQRFNEYFYGPQDYSVIGHRP